MKIDILAPRETRKGHLEESDRRGRAFESSPRIPIPTVVALSAAERPSSTPEPNTVKVVAIAAPDRILVKRRFTRALLSVNSNERIVKIEARTSGNTMSRISGRDPFRLTVRKFKGRAARVRITAITSTGRTIHKMIRITRK